MSMTSDEYVFATPDSTPAQLGRTKIFQYFTPENSPGLSRVDRLVPVPLQKTSISPESLAGEASRFPCTAPKQWKRSAAPSGPAAKRKLFPPLRRKFGRKKIDFKNALFKVLRKIDHAGTISGKAMAVLNDMMCDLLERLAGEAKNICEKNGKTTLKTRDIQTAARLALPGSLFTHAFYEGHRALRGVIDFDDARRAGKAGQK